MHLVFIIVRVFIFTLPAILLEELIIGLPPVKRLGISLIPLSLLLNIFTLPIVSSILLVPIVTSHVLFSSILAEVVPFISAIQVSEGI